MTTHPKKIFLSLSAITTFIAIAFHSTMASAHVKWFSDFSFSDKPRTLAEAVTPLFWGLMALSVFCIGLLAFLDYRLSSAQWTKNVTAWLESYKKYSVTIMRAGAAAVLLLSFQSGSLFVPDLPAGTEVLGWIQFTIALLLLFRRTNHLSGAGIIALYIYGIAQFGWFHMLDYAIFAGVGYYLLVSHAQNEKIRGTGLITLYLTVGFSLSWVAIEKLLYPQWGLYILAQNPQLALGLNLKFFLTSAAFIEISLGYLLMICLLQRSLALVVTIVFFLTTLVFGKTEVIGHTIIHAALIVFLIEGPGRTYLTPVEWHKKLPLRIAFACINFVLFVFLLLVPYQHAAMTKYETTVQKIKDVAAVEIDNPLFAPQVDLELVKDEMSGYALHIKTMNFKFAPEHTGSAYVPGEGHAHVFIDNKKVGRAYGPWFYFDSPKKGSHQIKVTLNTNDHRLILVDGKPVETIINLNVTDKSSLPAHQMQGMNH